ncbi:MAG TPA: DUF368 domain-containing protein [Chlamydiales bacterium]|nr:DUF368 domain-containing protein [Chlamydiales bacterium]
MDQVPGEQWKKPVYTKPWHWIRTFICGLCMGAADIVPGISGGTLAFIIGIYEDLLHSIASFSPTSCVLLLKGKFSAFFHAISWQFLLALVCGISCSFIALAKIITMMLNNELLRNWLYSGFVGLVGGSVYFCARQLKQWKMRYCFSFLFAAAAAFFLSGTDFIPKQAGEARYDVPVVQQHYLQSVSNYNEEKSCIVGVPESFLAGMMAQKSITPATVIANSYDGHTVTVKEVIGSTKTKIIDPWIVTCGAIAISAMLLPGISGSYLLTVLGMYGFILGALVDWVDGLKHLRFETTAFCIILSMVIGIIIGATCFSRVVLFLLNRFHNGTIVALIGFMVGALRSVWPFWTCSYELHPLRLVEGPQLHVVHPILPDIMSLQFGVSVLCVLLGFAAVLTIEFIAQKKATKVGLRVL